MRCSGRLTRVLSTPRFQVPPTDWGLRDYQLPPSVWGGNEDCEHEWGEEAVNTAQRQRNGDAGGLHEGRATNGLAEIVQTTRSAGQWCQLCGAWRGCLGLEPTPEAYVANMVEVFRAVWRVLRDDGCAFLNLGDSYARAGGWSDNSGLDGLPRGQSGRAMSNIPQEGSASQKLAPGLKPKDLVGIPWRVAFALQTDGWYLRSDIIWAKPNPMPESVTDRPTCAHEYVFLLSKSARYFFDAEAVKEEAAQPDRKRRDMIGGASHVERGQHSEGGEFTGGATRNIRTVWTIPTSPTPFAHFATFPPALVEPCVKAGTSERGCCPQCGKQWERVVKREKHPSRNMEAQREQARASTGRTDGHISGPGGMCDATRTLGFRPACVCGCPEPGMRPDDWDLVATPTGEREGEDPSLLVGRAGYSRPRHPEEGSRPITRYEQRQYADQLKTSPHRADMAREAGDAFAHYVRTDLSGARPIPPGLLARWLERGWLTPVVLPGYDPPEPSPCVVLDPFFGAGTVGLVAEQLGRDWIGCELNPEYAKLAQDRITAGGDLRGRMDAEKQEAAGQVPLFDA